MLLAALCAGLFVLSLLDHAAPGAFDRMVLANRYAADLAEEWRDRPIEELSGLVQLQRERLQDIYFWYFGDDEMEYPFETEEEALAYIADVSGLARAVREHDNDGVYRTYLAHDEALDALQR